MTAVCGLCAKLCTFVHHRYKLVSNTVKKNRKEQLISLLSENELFMTKEDDSSEKHYLPTALLYV